MIANNFSCVSNLPTPCITDLQPAVFPAQPSSVCSAIAAAWASLTHLGEDGFLRLARVMMDTAEQIMACVEDIDGVSWLYGCACLRVCA